jgi:hypothetical protein
MAKKDRKKWLKLFYSRWGYKPTSVIRKKPEYMKKIPLEEALMIASETDSHFLIQAIFPFEHSFPVNKESTDGVTIFPQVVYYNKNSLYETEEPILYDGVFYSLNDFIDKSPNISMNNANGTFGTYAFSLPFFMLSTDEVNHFRKLYLTPIRKEIVKAGIYPEARGTTRKKNRVRAERDRFIIKEYKKFRRKKPYPVSELKKKVEIKASELFSKNSKEYKQFCCKEQQIRRVLDRYTKK